MHSDRPSDSPKTIWQNQATETTTMTMEMIQQRVMQSESKRRRGLAGSVAMTIIVLILSAAGILWTRNVELRALFVLAIAWAFAGQGLLHRGMWSAAALRGDETLATGLEFYRQELDRHTSLFRRLLQWSFGPVILSILTLVATLVGITGRNNRPLISIAPFTTLVVVWTAAFFALRMREQKKLRREVDELQAAERASRR
jgi:type II secretory pathway component PulM